MVWIWSILPCSHLLVQSHRWLGCHSFTPAKEILAQGFWKKRIWRKMVHISVSCVLWDPADHSDALMPLRELNQTANLFCLLSSRRWTSSWSNELVAINFCLRMAFPLGILYSFPAWTLLNGTAKVKRITKLMLGHTDYN